MRADGRRNLRRGDGYWKAPLPRSDLVRLPQVDPADVLAAERRVPVKANGAPNAATSQKLRKRRIAILETNRRCTVLLLENEWMEH
jgi:hypothetical protein